MRWGIAVRLACHLTFLPSLAILIGFPHFVLLNGVHGESFVKVRVCFHDRCFDGASSASIFSRFYRERIDPQATFAYTGMTHTAAKPFEEGIFDGDENAIVDFKYSSSPRLTWWFDHHQSAFLTPADAAHFRAEHSRISFSIPISSPAPNSSPP